MSNVKRLNTGSIFWGVTFLLFGMVLLIPQFVDAVSLRMLWPALVLSVGVALLVMYVLERVKGNDAGSLIVTAVVVLTWGGFFQYLAVAGWHNFETWWPVMIFGVAVALLLYAFLAKVYRAYIVSGALFVLAATFTFIFTGARQYWPVVLIALGMGLLFVKSHSKEELD